MRTVHKYVLGDAENVVTTHAGAHWLHVAEQHGQIVAWAEVETWQPMHDVMVWVVGTGQEVPAMADRHIGSLVTTGGTFVFHVWIEMDA